MIEGVAPVPGLVRTGVSGLDEVLRGGLVGNRLYLVEGDPGAGKTTLALQFLLEGARAGERCLFVSLSENEAELRASAASHGWSLDGLDILEIIASEESLSRDARYTMYHPAEVELADTTRRVLSEAERLKPARLVVDSLSELRLLAENPLRYRRQILGLKQHFARRQCTVLFIDDRTGQQKDIHPYSLAHGVISLEHEAPDYGPTRRRLCVAKLRGRAFAEGYHDFTIRKGGLDVFPRLVASEHATSFDSEPLSSGIEALDALLGGGVTQGTSMLIVGPAGVGKSSMATQYVAAGLKRGQRAVVFLFDETIGTLMQRSSGLGVDLAPHIRSGQLQVQKVDPAQLSPGEFAHIVRRAVECGVRLVMIDSLNGYLNGMPSERFLLLHLHELLSYLGGQGVTTLMVVAQHGIVGEPQSVVDASYVADSVLLARYYEAVGEVRRAVSVVKKRTGRHEHAIRELMFTPRGLEVGETVRGLQGVLIGTPQFVGDDPLGHG